MITVEHTGPVIYGGAVTLARWYDNKRITAGTLQNKQIFKKYSTWAYLVPGVASLIATIWWKKYQGWTDRLTAGFLFGLPGFIYDSARASSGAATTAGAGAVAEAQRILAQKRAEAAQLAAGHQTGRTYEKEFQATGVL